MGVHLELENYNKLFHESRHKNPIIVNTIAESTEKEKKEFDNLIMTTYSGDLLSNLPSCEEGCTTGEHTKGDVCSVCGTVVVSHLDQPLEPMVWIKAPNGVRAVMNINVWLMLKKKFTRSGFEIVRWIADTTYHPQVKTPPLIKELEAMNIPRGWNNFVDNFDQIIDTLFNLKTYRVRIGTIDPLHRLLRQAKDCIFAEYMPVPNKALLVIEESNVGTYIDTIIIGAVNAIRMMTGIDSGLNAHTVRVKENRTVKCIALMGDYYEGLYKTTISKKPGILRKHVFGARADWSFRAVITSKTDKHNYDEIHIPWGIAISVLKIHLAGKLIRKGMYPDQIQAFLNEHAQKYHPLLDELFRELIAEAPGGRGIPCTMQRNPSLERGSAQSVFIPEVKIDTTDPSVSISILAVVGLNADFDGDQLNFTLQLDNMTSKAFRPLAPHMSTFDLNAPRKVSKNLSMPKPVVATIASWMHRPLGEPDPIKYAKMAALQQRPPGATYHQ